MFGVLSRQLTCILFKYMEDSSFFLDFTSGVNLAYVIHLWISVFGVEFICLHWAYLNRNPDSIYGRNPLLKNPSPRCIVVLWNSLAVP